MIVAVVLTLRPSVVGDRVYSLLTVPLRLAAEVTYPMRIGVRSQVVRASDRLEARQDLDGFEQNELRIALDHSTRPTEAGLIAGRRFVFAEIEGRSQRDPDNVRAWVPVSMGVEPGQPVIVGDVYVGRVSAVIPLQGKAGEARIDIELVTARGFQVGAQVEDGPAGEPVPMTVGGVRRDADNDSVDLAVHNPADRDLAYGLARVHELIRTADDFADLAEGFHLGDVVRHPLRSDWWLIPELDYLDGLFQVMVVTSLSAGGEVEPFDPATQSADWIACRPLTLGDANPMRDALKLRRGAFSGVTEGAAVTTRGAHLIGRVGRVGPLTANVRLLGDPGLSLVALAVLSDDPVPRPLGRLVSEGRDGAVLLFRWTPRVIVSGATDEVNARLFTGSGDPGLAIGFPVGSVRLPLNVPLGQSVLLRVLPDVDGRHASPLFVYAGARRVPR